LNGASRISWWSTAFGEAEALATASAVRAGRLSRGPITEELEARLAHELGVRGALVVPSGSAALVAAMLAVEVGTGDEVIVPDLTWIATANAAALLGARAVPVDCLEDRPLIDPEAVRRAMTPRTKAVVPVHLAGRAAPMTELRELCDGSGAALIEDAAQALGSRGPDGLLGTQGDVGVFSLGVAKLVSTGQGGVVVSNEPRILDRLRRIAFHGVEYASEDVPTTGFEERYRHLGLNLKFSDVLAAIGLEQLGRLEEKRARVREVHERYDAGLACLGEVAVEPFDLDGGELPLWTEVRCAERDALRARLTERGVETRLQHRPLHHAAHLAVEQGARFPAAERHARELLILPSGPSRSLEEVDRVVEELRSAVPVTSPA